MTNGPSSPAAPLPEGTPPEVLRAAETPRNCVGDYIAVEQIGLGGYGAVFRAWQRSLGRWVALKFLHSVTEADRQRFMREAMLEAKLSHPNIVPVYEVGTYEGTTFLTMRLVSGATLDTWTKLGGAERIPSAARSDADPGAPDRARVTMRLSTRRACEILCDVASAVQSAHDAGVVHRDLKPQNVMLDDDGHVWVMDFGVARSLAGGATVTAAGLVTGTPAYMSPEQATGRRCDERSDVYSMGATLYELLTGKAPFRGTTLVQVLADVIQRDPVSPRQLEPQVGRELEAIVVKAMDKDPARRYRSARAFGDDLRRWLDGRAVQARSPGKVARSLRWVKRHRLLSAMAVTAVIAVLGLATGGVLSYVHIRRTSIQAEAERREAEVKLAQSLVSQADALGSTQRWREALERYREAHALMSRLGESTAPAELGLLGLLHNASPPLASYAAHAERAVAVAFSGDGKRLFTGGTDRVVRIWDTTTGRLVRELRGHTDGVWSLAVSPDGGRLLTGGWDGHAVVWDLARGQRLLTLTHQGKVGAVAFSPNGRQLMTGGEDRALHVWDAATGTELRAMKGHTDRVRSIAVSHDGRAALTGSGDGTAKLWDLKTGSLRQTFVGHRGIVFGVAFTPDGSRAVTAGDDRAVRVWDLTSGRLLHSLAGHQNVISAVVVSPDGQRALTASWDTTIRTWDLENGREVAIYAGHTQPAFGIAIAGDGHLAASVGGDGAVKLWSLEDPGTPVPLLPGRRILSLAISPDRRLLAGTSLAGDLVVWDIATLSLLAHLRGTPPPLQAPAREAVWNVVFTPDGRRLLVGMHDGAAVLWDIATRRIVQQFPGTEPVYATSITADGLTVAVARASNRVVISDLATGATKQQLPGRMVAWMPDGRSLLAASREGGLSLWDAAAGTPIRSFAGHRTAISSLALSPDGARAITGSVDNTLRLWEVATGRLSRELVGHVGPPRSVAFLPDGQRALSASDDGSVRLWDLTTGSELHSFTDPERRPESLVLATAGDLFITGDLTGRVRSYDFREPVRVLDLVRRLGGWPMDGTADAGTPDAWLARGEWLALRGACSQALAWFARARASGAAPPALDAASCHWRVGERAAAREEILRAMREQPGSISPLSLQLALSALAGDAAAVADGVR